MSAFKGAIGAITLAAMVASTTAFAADGALSPGKPAGIKNAQIGTGTLLIAGGAAAIALGVAITVTNQSGDKTGQQTSFAPVTTTTSP
ncbi:MAG TPA: hypothetical protein VHC40_04510 [Rhizomicrobium sp.]|jgi:hypothetical protein|nr:hypothetical protein [Rhizomicrobium sp.]